MFIFVIRSLHCLISLEKLKLKKKDHLRQFFECTSEAQGMLRCKGLLELFH